MDFLIYSLMSLSVSVCGLKRFLLLVIQGTRALES